MKRPGPLVWLLVALVVLAVPACSFSASTANIGDAKMARDAQGNDPTEVFSPDDTTLKAVWTAVDVEGANPNTKIDEVNSKGGSGQVQFELSNDGPWPVGEYKVDLFLNDEQEPAQTLEFRVR
jgi:hypothetical protein